MEKKNELQIVTVKTLPELIDRTEEVARAVRTRIDALNLKNIEATEENVIRLTGLRATLNKELKAFENDRKEVKRRILTPYEQFEEVYVIKIKKLYEDNIKILNDETNKIYQARRDKEIAAARAHFDNLAAVYNLKEAKFESVAVNYQSGKQMKLSIETYFENLKGALLMIDNHPFKSRLYTLWEQNGRNLNVAAAKLNDQLEAETRRVRELEAQEARKQAEPEDLIEPEVVATEPYNIEEVVDEEIIEEEPVVEEVLPDEQYRFNLSVACTQKELESLVEFLFLNGIDYNIN